MIVDRALVPEVMVIPGSSGSLQMVDHTLIDVPLANVYLDSPYYKGHCRVMCVSSPVYPLIIGNVRGARRMLPDPDWKAEDQPGVRARTSGGNKDKDNDDDQGGDIPAWIIVAKGLHMILTSLQNITLFEKNIFLIMFSCVYN